MFIVTNREVDETRTDFGAFKSTPNSKGPNELRLAEATRVGQGWKISVLPDIIPDAMANEAGIKAPIDPITKQKLPIYGSRYVAHKLHKRVNPSAYGSPSKGRNLVFFIHGFNNDIKSVLDRARQLEENYDVEVLIFSWPANGGGVHGVVSYKSDKRDALASTGALDRCLARIGLYLDEFHAESVKRIEEKADQKFSDDAEKWDRYYTSQVEKCCPFTINMVLHSMGNYLYKHLLKSSTYRGNLLLFDNVVLVAADTNNEEHAEWVDRIQCRGRILITINEEDSALKASRMKMGEAQKARLGHYPFRLDASRAVYVDFTGESYVSDSHSYFEGGPLRNSRVRKFFDKALNGEVPEETLTYDTARKLYQFK